MAQKRRGRRRGGRPSQGISEAQQNVRCPAALHKAMTVRAEQLGVEPPEAWRRAARIWLGWAEMPVPKQGAARRTASLGELDPFRLQHRVHLKAVVADVVRLNLVPRAARRYVEAYAASHLPKDARIRFVAVVQEELGALHPGNYARYKVSAATFNSWWAHRAP